MNKETKIIYSFVILALLLVGAFIFLWSLKTSQMNRVKLRSNDNQERFVTSDINTTDADGVSRNFSDLRGKVWLISHVFTRCPGQCAGVCAVIDELRKEVNDSELLHLVSVTLDPSHDDASQLKAFSQKHGLVSNDWWFLTGNPDELNSYMLDTFSLSAQEKNEEQRSADLMIYLLIGQWSLWLIMSLRFVDGMTHLMKGAISLCAKIYFRLLMK